MGGGRLEDQVLAMLRGQLADIILGAVFLFIGLAACSIAAIRAAIRRRSGVRIFVWLGIWTAMHGAMQLSQSSAVLAASPRWLQISASYANTVMTYLTVVVGLLSFMELRLGRVRFLIQTAACLGLAFVFAIQALWNHLSRPLGFETPPILHHLGFAILLFSFGYVALHLVFANERRLLSVENELAIAREIQTSILPSDVPEINNLSFTSAYRPMTAVAGDFYDFIPVDQKRVGSLVADVTGHGGPAALIASMIKVAMQSVVPCAHDPREVLRGLNRILFRQLHNQLVSAAYLWLDTENHKALYSAAGHPPLLRWREGKLEPIESNGLLFGVIPDPDYPVCDLPIRTGDRFLLYTDGVIEPENASGDSFGDWKLEQVVRNNQSRPPSELSDQLLSEIRLWQPASLAQHDDITLIVIDVL